MMKQIKSTQTESEQNNKTNQTNRGGRNDINKGPTPTALHI